MTNPFLVLLCHANDISGITQFDWENNAWVDAKSVPTVCLLTCFHQLSHLIKEEPMLFLALCIELIVGAYASNVWYIGKFE